MDRGIKGAKEISENWASLLSPTESPAQYRIFTDGINKDNNWVQTRPPSIPYFSESRGACCKTKGQGPSGLLYFEHWVYWSSGPDAVIFKLT